MPRIKTTPTHSHLLDQLDTAEFQTFVTTNTRIRGQQVYLTAFEPNDGRPAFNTLAIHGVTSVRLSRDGKRLTITHDNGITTEVDLFPVDGGMSINRGGES